MKKAKNLGKDYSMHEKKTAFQIDRSVEVIRKVEGLLGASGGFSGC